MQRLLLLAGALIIFAMMATMPVFAQPSASAARDIEKQTLAPGQSTNVTVTLTNNVTQALVLDEDMPAGWNLTRVSDDADMYKPSTNEWLWISVGAGETKTVIYNLTVPSNATAGDYSISGTISNASGVIDTVKGESIITVVPDATPPTIEFIEPTPENGSTVTVNYVNVTASVTDASGVASVLLNWNGENETMWMIGPSNFSRNTTYLPNGIYTYKVYANDIYDNWGASEKRTAAYVSAKPDLVITDKWVNWPECHEPGINCTICYNVTNIGNGTASAGHNTTLYVDGEEVAHDLVDVNLAPNASYIGCFDDYNWTYTPPDDNITVCADNYEEVNESTETNNCMTNIWKCGDVNEDGRVTMSDVRKVYNRYLDPGYPLDLPWAADVNCDGRITMSDVRKVYNRYLDPSYDLNCCCEQK